MSDAKTLSLFYRAVLGWIINPANNPYEFKNTYGLCDNLYYKYSRYGQKLYEEQTSLFNDKFMNSLFPFGGANVFVKEVELGALYRNHDRVNFVVEQVVSPELRKVMQETHAELLAGNVVKDSLCFLHGVEHWLYTELHQLFAGASLDADYPFNKGIGSAYGKEDWDGKLYKNPLRLHFVSVLAGKPGTLDHLAVTA